MKPSRHGEAVFKEKKSLVSGHKEQPLANSFQGFFVEQQARIKTLVVKWTSKQRGIVRGRFINCSAQARSLPDGMGFRAETNDLTLCKI